MKETPPTHSPHHITNSKDLLMSGLIGQMRMREMLFGGKLLKTASKARRNFHAVRGLTPTCAVESSKLHPRVSPLS